jgi:glycosyltransferase involved in cell wall biosynthesis
MKIALVNSHVAYIYLLAKTGHDFYVFNHIGGVAWDLRQRPLPPNVHLVDNVQAFTSLLSVGTDFFDRIILQDTIVKGIDGNPDILDRLIFERFTCPKVLLFHNSFNVNFRMPIDQQAVVIAGLVKRLKGIKKVYISEFKRKSWAMPGDVILPGIDLDEFGGWRGIENRPFCCLNNANYRDFMNGTGKMQLACANLNLYMLGEEQGRGKLAENFEVLKQHYRDFMVYLCLNNPDFEDGYNLSMLEAMATGMPAVTLDHPTSPIQSGVNGFKSNDLSQINKFLKTLTQEKAHALGRKARETVAEKFQMSDFIRNWNDVLDMP